MPAGYKSEYTLTCPECLITKTLEDFPKHRSKAKGRCKKCQSGLHKRWYAEKGQDYFLGKQLGLSAKQYAEMHIEQRGLCAICHGPETAVDTRTGLVRRLSTDHNHALKKGDRGFIRGLLCRACNQGLGSFRDNPDRLRMAAEYLENSLVIQ